MTSADDESVRDPRRSLEHFTDREFHLQTFRRLLDVPEGEALPVLTLHGVGGNGKTTLLDRLGHELDTYRPPIPHARFDVENVSSPAKAAREALLRLRVDLESAFQQQFPRFDLLLSVILVAEGGQPPALVRMNPTLKDVFDSLVGLWGIPSDRIGKFLQTQASKSDTLRRLLARAGGGEEILQLAARARRDDSTLADELIDRFADDLSTGLPVRPGKACRGVLFFDTFETLWKGSDLGRSVQARRLDAWLRQLARQVRERGVLVVIAGRDELRWAEDDAEWAGAVETHMLGGLSRHDAQIYLAKRTIGPRPWSRETPLQAAIIEACSASPEPDGEVSCHPFFLALCGDIVDNFRDKGGGANPPNGAFAGMPSDHVARLLAERFLKSLPNERWELWIKELSLTPSFDERAALELDRDRHHNLGRAGWKHLCRYSFLEPLPEQHFRLHKTMRDVLRTGLEDDAADVHAWFLDYWSGREEPALAFFHRWSLNPEAALVEWREDHATSLNDLRMPAARTLLDSWSEIALDGLMRRWLGDRLWAATHFSIGLALWQTPVAPRAPALNAAIAHFEAALGVYTEDEFPPAWAITQNNLGNAYLNLPTGDRTENLERAIACFESALQVFNESDFPSDWARAQNNLGAAYTDFATGDHGENLKRAIACHESALRIYTELGFPSDWARTQNNLGAAYWSLATGNRGENLERAIACYETALRVSTELDFPSDWARTQNNLGLAYGGLLTGDPDENLNRAIACFEWALQVFNESDFPADWAMTQFNLGSALKAGGRLDESEQAFASAAKGYERVGDAVRADEARREAEESQLMRDQQTEL